MSNLLPDNFASKVCEPLPLLRALLENEHDLLTVATQLCGIVDAAPVLISYVDLDMRYRMVNRMYCEWFQRPVEAFIGQTTRSVVGDAAYEKTLPYFQKAYNGKQVRYEMPVPYGGNVTRFVRTDMIPDRADDGTVRGLVLVIVDITAHYNSERREQFVAALVERTRPLTDPDAVLDETVRSVGSFLGLSRYLFADVDTDAGQVTIRRDFRSNNEIASMVGTWELAAWGDVIHEFAVGRTAVSSDSKSDPRMAGDAEAAYDATEIRASVTVPVHRGGKWVGVFSAQMCGAPRDWTADEVALLEMVAQHMWVVLENARILQNEKQNVVRQRRFVRDLLFSLTQGKLTLCESDNDLPSPLSHTQTLELSGHAIRLLRSQVEAETERLHFPKEHIHDLLTATAEAAMNAVVHGGGGTGQVCTDDERGIVQVWVRDQGTGITDEALPRAFEKGASTTGTLGHGFYLIMNTCDRVWILTSTDGTTVVLEQDRRSPKTSWMG